MKRRVLLKLFWFSLIFGWEYQNANAAQQKRSDDLEFEDIKIPAYPLDCYNGIIKGYVLAADVNIATLNLLSTNSEATSRAAEISRALIIQEQDPQKDADALVSFTGSILFFALKAGLVAALKDSFVADIENRGYLVLEKHPSPKEGRELCRKKRDKRRDDKMPGTSSFPGK